MKHASALVAVLARNLTSATSKGNIQQQAGVSTSFDSSAAAQSETSDGQDEGNLHAKHAHYSFIMILVLMTLFILVTLTLTGAMLAFCRKKNAVFTHYDGVATTSGEFVGGRGAGRVSVDGISELELGDLDADGEGMCGAADRGQCYYQLSDDSNDDSFDSSDNKSDEDDEKIRRNEQKKMLRRYRGASKLAANRRNEDNKKEVVLETNNEERRVSSNNSIVHFSSNKHCRKKNFNAVFKMFKKKDLVPLTGMSTNCSSSVRNISTMATKSITFPPSKKLDFGPKFIIDHKFQNNSTPIEEKQEYSKRESTSTQLTDTESTCAPTKPTSPLSPVEASISFYPGSSSKRSQLNGIGNANFKTAGRRRKNMTCVNPQHSHRSCGHRKYQNKKNGELSTIHSCNQSEAHKLRRRQDQGQSYQARLYRRLQEQAYRLNRGGHVPSLTFSGFQTCAQRKHNHALYQMHALRRYLADPYWSCSRLHRCHTIHAIPQTGPESITESPPLTGNKKLQDNEAGDKGGSAVPSSESRSSSKVSQSRRCRTLSKCGITIVRVEPSLDISDECGDVETGVKSSPYSLSELQTSREKHIPGTGNKAPTVEKDIVLENLSNFSGNTSPTNPRSDRDCFYKNFSSGINNKTQNVFAKDDCFAATNSETFGNEIGSNNDYISGGYKQDNWVSNEEEKAEKQFSDLYLLPDLNVSSVCCETTGNTCSADQNNILSLSARSLSTGSIHSDLKKSDEPRQKSAASYDQNKSASSESISAEHCSQSNVLVKYSEHFGSHLYSQTIGKTTSTNGQPDNYRKKHELFDENLVFSISTIKNEHSSDDLFGKLELFLSCDNESFNTTEKSSAVTKIEGDVCLAQPLPSPQQWHRKASSVATATTSSAYSNIPSAQHRAPQRTSVMLLTSPVGPVFVTPQQNQQQPTSPSSQKSSATEKKTACATGPSFVSPQQQTFTPTLFLPRTTTGNTTPRDSNVIFTHRLLPQLTHEQPNSMTKIPNNTTVPSIVAIPPPPKSQRSSQSFSRQKVRDARVSHSTLAVHSDGKMQ